MKKYIYVLDENIADFLIGDGNKPLNVIDNGNVKIWVFANTGRFNFSKEDSQKVYYSNTLRICL